MSKYMSYICDICGRDIEGPSAQAISEKTALIKLWGPGEYRAGGGQRKDLCLNCYEKFVNFLDGGNCGDED